MATVNSYFCLILYLSNLEVGISDDSFYEKFIQADYKISYEREVITYMNKSYVELTLSTFKYNRTHFATNSTLLFKIDVGNDVEIIVQAYKFLSNEYRIFPMRFEYNLCKGLKYDVGGVNSCAENCGYINCPIKKNIQYSICNCILDESKFPPFMPNGQFKLGLEGRYQNKLMATTDTYLSVYRPILPKKRVG